MSENKKAVPVNSHIDNTGRRCYWVWASLLVILLFTAAVRIRLLNVPLERDEGGYAYIAQLILQGIPPYTQAYDIKPPGLYAVYALFMALFGQTRAGIHLGLLVVNAGTIILLFLLAKRLFGNLAAIVAALAFAVMSVGRPVQGVFANAEHFVILPAMAGFLLLLRAVRSDRLLTVFFSGFLLGLAFIIKQPGVAFIAGGGFYLLYSQLRIRPVDWLRCLLKCVLFAVGAALPFAISCLILWCLGSFDKFWFWVFVYPRDYVSSAPLSYGLLFLKTNVIRIAAASYLLWLLAGMGLTAVVWNKKVRSQAPFVLMFFLFSFLSVCPGLYFRPHYFVLLLPAVALLAGLAVGSIAQLFSKVDFVALRKAIPALLAFVAVYQAVYSQQVFLFRLTAQQVSWVTYDYNPFPESLEVAGYIKENSSKNDSIIVLGSEAQIYFYSDRHSCSPYIFTHPLVARHKYAKKMQQEMINDIENARPKFMVFVSVTVSWVFEPGAEELIFDWFEQYRRKYYRPVGAVDIWRHKPTVYRWGRDAENYHPESKHWIAVFKRNE